MKGPGRRRLWVIGIAVAFLGFALIYYLLQFVPAQREYFMNLRFRSLAVAGSQVRGKIQHLALAMEYYQGQPSREESGWARYVGALVPDLEKPGESAPKGDAGVQVRVEMGGAEPALVLTSGGLRAEARVSRLLTGAPAGGLFNDLLLATREGAVLLQTSESGPRILHLAKLIGTDAAEKPEKGWLRPPPRQGDGSGADRIEEIQLDGTRYHLLIQPVRLGLPLEGGTGAFDLLLAGLVPSSRVRSEAMHVPPKYLLVVVIPVAILILAMPFLKLEMLTPTSRFQFRDVFLLAMCTIFSTGLAAIALGCLSYYTGEKKKLDVELGGFAERLNRNIVQEIGDCLRQLRSLDRAAGPQAKDRTDILVTMAGVLSAGPDRPLGMDFVFWTNEAGDQIEKWTTKRRNTARVNQMREEYFRDLLAGNTLLPEPGKDDLPPFTLQTLISPTTARLIVAMAIESGRGPVGVSDGKSVRAMRVKSANLVASPQSVVAPVIPPGLSFAVLKPDGGVVFHSNPERNLHENLFEECRDPGPLRRAISKGMEEPFSLYYRGREYRGHVRWITGVSSLNRALVVLGDVEPLQARTLRIAQMAGAWFLIVLVLLGLGFLGSMALQRRAAARPGATWKTFILEWCWPRRDLLHAYRAICPILLMLVCASALFLVYSGNAPFNEQGLALAVSYLTPFLALSLVLAILVNTRPRKRGHEAEWETRGVCVANLCLIAMLAGGIPAAGFFQVCQKYEDRVELKWRQHVLAGRIEQRQRDVVAGIRRSPAYTEETKRLLAKGLAQGRLSLDPAALHNYFPGSTEVLESAARAPRAAARPPLWQSALADWHSEAMRQDDESGAIHVEELGGGTWEWSAALPRGSQPERVVLSHHTSRPDDGFRWNPRVVEIATAVSGPGAPPLSLAATAALLVFLLAAWTWRSSRKLFLWEMRPCPLRSLAQALASPSRLGNFLLLGLPLSGKDREAMARLGNMPRVNLREETFTPGWLEWKQEALLAEIAPPQARAAAATAGGAVSTSSAPPPPRWVHISNLEAKIVEAKDRQVVLDLLDWLLCERGSTQNLRIVVTSAVDPTTHFDSILREEKTAGYQNALPEPELQRWSRVLSKFEKVAMPPVPASKPPGREPWVATLWSECHTHKPLIRIRRMLFEERTGPEVLMARIEELAGSFYRLVWAASTRAEKLVMVQLAQTGMVNPHQRETLQDLSRKHLVFVDPTPRLLNESFRHFLERVEPPETIRAWEREGGENLWPLWRNLILLGAVAVLIALAVTQEQALQSVAAAVGVVLTAVTGLGKILDSLIRKGRTDAAAADSV